MVLKEVAKEQSFNEAREVEEDEYAEYDELFGDLSALSDK